MTPTVSDARDDLFDAIRAWPESKDERLVVSTFADAIKACQ